MRYYMAKRNIRHMLFDQVFLFQLLALISCTVSLGVALFCWQRRDIAAARAYSVVAFSQAWWTIGYLFELNSPELEWKIFWDNTQFIGMAGWCSAFIVFAVRYSNYRLRSPAFVYAIFSLPSLALILLAYTDPLHNLIRANPQLVVLENNSVLLYDFTGVLLFFCIYMYILYLVAVWLLLFRSRYTTGIYNFQIGLLLFGSLIPVIGTMLTLTVLQDWPVRDITPLTFGISNVLIAFGLVRYRLFDLVPVARDIVLEQMSDMVYIFDANNRIVDMNTAAVQSFPVGKAPHIGQDATEAFSDYSTTLERFQSTHQAYNDELELEMWGGIRRLELRIQPIYDQNKRYRGRIVVARDITERRRIEQQLAQYREQLELLVEQRTADLSQTNAQLQQEIVQRQQLEMRVNQALRLEALGRVTGGIAHDFNNILMIIQVATHLAFEHTAVEEELHEDLRTIEQAVTQASGLVRHLLIFSRKQATQPSFVDLNKLVADMDKLLHHLLNQQVQLLLELRATEALIFADPVQVQQIVMNLVVNARDAMPEGGTIRLSTNNAHISEADLQHHIGLTVGAYICLSVADTGTGMSQETLMRIFEPFFTTKQEGKGTGLGLAIVHGTVKQNRGDIEVESAPGKGTVFRIYLPLAEQFQLDDTPDLLQEHSTG
jgi:PAS domain S-box-containing protein